MVAAERAFEQLDGRVNRLGVELAGAVERDGIRAVLQEQVGEPLGQEIESGVPVDGPEFVAA